MTHRPVVLVTGVGRRVSIGAGIAAQLARRLGRHVVNPGPVDTGWMDDAVRQAALAPDPRSRLATPQDTADLVAFLPSDRGGRIDGRLLFSDGGWTA